MEKDLDTLHTIYMNARERAWNIYDRLARDARDTDALYQKALRVQERTWANYIAARNAT